MLGNVELRGMERRIGTLGGIIRERVTMLVVHNALSVLVEQEAFVLVHGAFECFHGRTISRKECNLRIKNNAFSLLMESPSSMLNFEQSSQIDKKRF